MFRSILAAMVIMTAFAVNIPVANAERANLVVKDSSHDFATTVKRLTSEIEKRGAKVVATVDHAAAAKRQGISLRPTTMIMFGNPLLGTPLMQDKQSAGIDLPLRIVVWKNADGDVQIGYWPPSQIAESHGLSGVSHVTDKMTAALGAITDAAANK